MVCWSCKFQCFIQRRAGGLSDAASAFYTAAAAAITATGAVAAAARVVYIDDADIVGEWVLGSARSIAKRRTSGLPFLELASATRTQHTCLLLVNPQITEQPDAITLIS